MRPHLGVLTFGVFAHDDHVDGGVATEDSGHTGDRAERPKVDVLVELAAIGMSSSHQRNVIGHAGIANRPEQDRVFVP